MSRSANQKRRNPLLVDPPPARVRKWINLGIAVFLAVQVAVPLSYYLFQEPPDERFAWRMFSSVHMADWSRLKIVEKVERGGRTLQAVVPVEDLLVESSWQNLYAGHSDYRDRFLDYYLDLSGADEVTYEAQGIWPSGKPMEPIRATRRRSEQPANRR